MRNWFAPLVLGGLIAQAGAQSGSITVDASKVGAPISKGLYGVFLEEISHAGEGGLYAELLQNRGFEDANLPPACHLENGQVVPPRTPHYWTMKVSDFTLPWPVTSKYPGWSLHAPQGSKTSIDVVSDRPLNANKAHALAVDLDGKTASVENEGYWGIGVVKGASYRLRLWAQADKGYRGQVVAKLVGQDGKVLASKPLADLAKGRYGLIATELTARASDSKAHFALEFAGKGRAWLGYVSLFPAKTFKDRPNGLRADLGQMIADLKPGFVRFPGGCYVEGFTVEMRPQWQLTLGPIEQRTPTYSMWGYWNTNGFGFHEWLQFCEDIHSEPLYVFNVGVSCAFRSGTFIPDDQLPSLIQNTLDAIEYANGPTTSKWGALRAKNGHPKPFNMKYVEIGNEQQGPRYGARVAKFYKAIKAKYPKMNVILSSWIAGIDHAAIDAAGKIDFVDEHAYTALNWSIWNFDSFAKYPRDVDWKLYIGEFACNGGVGRGNLAATLNDAAYMMSMEKNSDLIKMGSYAPLLENVNSPHWEVNMIHFDPAKAFGRATYYACKMFADNLPTVNLKTQFAYDNPKAPPIGGKVGLGTFAGFAEYKDLKIEQGGKAVYTSDFANGNPGWTPETGQWSVKDGAYGQRGREDYEETYSLLDGNFHDVDLSVKARKIKGAEGFLLTVGNIDGMRVQVNLGGWGNVQHAIQINSGSPVAVTRGRIETDRWYDIRVQTRGRSIKVFLDDKKILDCKLPESNALLAIAGRDDATHEIVLKVVNNGADAKSVDLDILGANVQKTARQIVLTSPNANDENSMEQPTKIVPRETVLAGVGSHFRHTFAPYSLTILRLKAR